MPRAKIEQKQRQVALMTLSRLSRRSLMSRTWTIERENVAALASKVQQAPQDRDGRDSESILQSEKGDSTNRAIHSGQTFSCEGLITLSILYNCCSSNVRG